MQFFFTLWQILRLLYRFKKLAILLVLIGYAGSVYYNFFVSQIPIEEYMYDNNVIGQVAAQFIPIIPPEGGQPLTFGPWYKRVVALRHRDQASETSLPYNRDDWPHWIDADQDCQNTRTETLIAHSQVPVTLTRNGCRVIHGQWRYQWMDPHSEGVHLLKEIRKVHLDHHVPLADAHRSGGAQWSTRQKMQFANDPENLIIMYGPDNMAKSDQAPHQWLPARSECDYLKHWIYIKTKYDLSVTQEEKRGFYAIWERYC